MGSSITVHWVVPKIKIVNNFGAGTVKINGNTYNSGVELATKVGREFSIEAVNQMHNGTMKYFEQWRLPTGATTYNNPYSFTILKANAYTTKTYTAEFGDPVIFYVENNFQAGNIKVDNDTLNHGALVTRPKNSPVTLGSINQSYGNYQRVWNNSYPNEVSQWRRRYSGQTTTIDSAFQPSHQFTVTQTDNGAAYIADMKRKYNVYTSGQTEFDGNTSTVLFGDVVEGNNINVFADTLIINNRIYNFYSWSDGNLLNPRPIVPGDHTFFTALYKYPHHSNQTDAYENNSQRKFIRHRRWYSSYCL